MGENVKNDGVAVGDVGEKIVCIDWQSICDEIEILSASGISAEVVSSLKDAASKKDSTLLRACLKAATISADFLVDLGANVLATIFTS